MPTFKGIIKIHFHSIYLGCKYCRSMVREGIPHSLRPYIWMRLAGAMTKRANSEVSYRQIVRYVSCICIILYHVIFTQLNCTIDYGCAVHFTLGLPLMIIS